VKDSSLFILGPYLAVAVLIAGLLVRYVLATRQPDSLKEKVQQAKAMFGGELWNGKLWKISLLVLLVVHLALLLLPRAVLSWDGSPARLYLLEGLAFLAGLAAVASGAKLIWRHFGKSSASALAEICDTVFLSLLFVALVSGVLVAIRYRWASSWGAMILTPYTLSLLRGRPAVELTAQLPYLTQLHVLSSFAAVGVIPFTRLANLLVALIHGCVGLLTRPVVATGSAAEAWLQRRSPERWFWPEED
jgi:nitrate reductase gamma subunit